MRRFGVRGAAAAVLVLAVACSSSSSHRSAPLPGTVRASPITGSGYDVPQPLAPADPGTLIASSDAPAQAAMLDAGRARRILFHSTDLAGHDIAVSGLVLLPRGPRPAGGWPVVAWAHGTTGLADQCAPSVAPQLGPDPSAVLEVRALLAHHLAVVASDYPGLGTLGVHAYLIGTEDASSVIDSVAAAHAMPDLHLSSAWVTVGHSEGGQTALFVSQAPTARLTHWRFLGTVAIAPASHLDLLIPVAEQSHDPVDQAYMLYALAGLGAVDPSVHLQQLLTPAAQVIAKDLTAGCIDRIVDDLRRARITRLLAAPAGTIARLRARLGQLDNPGQQVTRWPVLIVQGTADTDVPSGATDVLVRTMCGLGDQVDYQHYPGLDHEAVVPASFARVDAWITARFADAVAPTTCG